MRFKGELKFPEVDHPGVPVQFLLDDNQVELVVDEESLGRWSLYDVHARRLIASAFQIDLDGTEVTFVANDPIDFAYRGVEHMAGSWASIKSKRLPTRSLAIRKSRKGTIPSKIEDLRSAMQSNLETVDNRPRMTQGLSGLRAADPVVDAPDAPEAPADRDRAEVTDPVDSAPVVEQPATDTEVTSSPVSDEQATPDTALHEERQALEEERRKLVAERARLEKQREATEEREANLVEAYRLEMQRLEAEREEMFRRQEGDGEPSKSEPAESEPAESEPAESEPAPVGRHTEPEDVDHDEEPVPAADTPEPAASSGVVDLNDYESGEEPGPAGSAPAPVAPPPEPEPAMAAVAKDKRTGGIMGAVKAAFRSGPRDHEHQFIEAPGGIGITRYVCEECGYVSISAGD